MNGLIGRYGEVCTRLQPAFEADGLGGAAAVWREGPAFEAAIRTARPDMRVSGAREREAGRCAVFTPRGVVLRPGDVFRRASGAVYRVVGPDRPCPVPDGAGIDLALVVAERWDTV